MVWGLHHHPRASGQVLESLVEKDDRQNGAPPPTGASFSGVTWKMS